MTPRSPHSTAFLRAASLLAVVGAVLAACKTDYQQGKEDPAFGLPNALAGQTQPGPSSDLSNGTSGSSAGAAACGTAIDGGTCAASFKDILAAFKTGGCDSTACHGGSNPPNQPKIDTTDPLGTWNIFAAFKMSNGAFYINPCSTDPTKSAIEANVDPAGDKTLQGTLMPSGVLTGLPADVRSKITTWQKCAAPNN
jgi:hypothetical protein